jgi:hypothetical protein
MKILNLNISSADPVETWSSLWLMDGEVEGDGFGNRVPALTGLAGTRTAT